MPRERRAWFRPLVVMGAIAALATAGCGGGRSAPQRLAGRAPSRPATNSVHRRRALGARGVVPASVPVLGFHEIRNPPPGARYPELYLDPAKFARIVSWLRQRGFQAVTVERVIRAWRGRATLPERPAVLTFDDGYASVYRFAFPVLQRLHWPGVLNLELAELHSPDGLRPPEVRALYSAGWEIASHTLTHPDLTQASAPQLRHELVGSRRLIARLFGVQASDFCYPAGRFDRRVERAVAAAGYRAAQTELPGLAARSDDPLALRRIMIRHSEPLETVFSLISRVRAAALSAAPVVRTAPGR